ncbi:MAG TPA: DUF3313 family protein [Cellvibrio sp.]|nr:DUF3313 family protein [Cellvibrio sp.]
MKYLWSTVVIALCLTACSGLQPHEKIIHSQAQQVGLVEVKKSRFDAAFVAPSAAFAQYKKIIIRDLDLSQVTIIEPSSQGAFARPWSLSDEDKRYYQTRFAESAKKNLFTSGLFAPAATSAADTLVLSGKITEIAPHAVKDDFKSRPGLMDVYSKGFGRMTIVFELTDSVTQKSVMVATDEHDLGNMWELNNRVQNNLRIRLAFDYWLRSLEKELSAAAIH